jgi:hypothetical protein
MKLHQQGIYTLYRPIVKNPRKKNCGQKISTRFLEISQDKISPPILSDRTHYIIYRTHHSTSIALKPRLKELCLNKHKHHAKTTISWWSFKNLLKIL